MDQKQSLEDLQMETEHIREGGFARIYRGTFKGEAVVVKQFARRGNMDLLRKQFLAEALIHS